MYHALNLLRNIYDDNSMSLSGLLSTTTSSLRSSAEVAALRTAGASDTQITAYQTLQDKAGGVTGLTNTLTSGARTVNSTLNSIPTWLYGGMTFATGTTTSQTVFGIAMYAILFLCLVFLLFFV